MSGSTFGTIFKIMTWGESHGKALGVVIDGCPPGVSINEEDINCWLRRRRPGKTKYESKRQEEDNVQILSGIFEGKTTGTPISMLIYNEDVRSHDYDEIKDIFRPSHADYCYFKKYGIRDYRGGGRSSGRETVGRVMAGAVANKILSEMGIVIKAYVKSIGSIEIQNNDIGMAREFLDSLIEKGDSVGGVVECVIDGVKAGIGEPVFNKLDAELSKAIMSIGAVKGVEFGEGFGASALLGSQNNDEFYLDENRNVRKRKNNAGGILGGISDGSQIVFRAAFKPTPSISLPQKTLNEELEEKEITIKGRHDPVIVPRAVVVVEAMSAIALLDLILQSNR